MAGQPNMAMVSLADTTATTEGPSACATGSSVAHPPWRGVSLGGWLLLEPGPAKDLFSRYKAPNGQEATCEWDLMQILRKKDAISALREHRDTYITKRDFERIRCMGLNAVRIPFGYWIVLGSSSGDPYLGPAIEYLDRAVAWAEETGIQVLLDLHGAPGGESCDAPCGRRQRPHSRWHWTHWRFEDSLKALDIVVRRYRGSRAVTGIAVCNEPSALVPQDELCAFYERAVDTVRVAGMSAERVTVVLPVFQRSLCDFADAFARRTAVSPKENVCFELHYYHCFEHSWHGCTMAQHLREVQNHTDELSRYPTVVGEWSLALGRGARPGRLELRQMRALFARAQLAAYRAASHGWFFWTWRDAAGSEWDWQQSFEDKIFPLSLTPESVELPKWDGCGEDPLEEQLDAPPSEPRARVGDTVFLRTYNGTYLDVEDQKVQARFHDRGEWQRFIISAPSNAPKPKRAEVRDGDLVCLLAHTGRYLGVATGAAGASGQVSARWVMADARCTFIVRTDGVLRHRGAFFLQSRNSSGILGIDRSGKGKLDGKVTTSWTDFGEWQRLVVEKLPDGSNAATPVRRRRSCVHEPPSVQGRRSLCSTASLCTPVNQRVQNRRSSVGSCADKDNGTTAAAKRRLARRASVGSCSVCVEGKAATPRKRRLSTAVPSQLCEAVSSPIITPAKRRISLSETSASKVVAAPTPLRRRSLTSGDGDVLEAGAPLKQRTLSSASGDDGMAAPPSPKRQRTAEATATNTPGDCCAVAAGLAERSILVDDANPQEAH
eukprot:gnl/TRDRNA2_/TRDRNA2_50928_c0_seq1.p1 gnl/TRDRNA2_/TRDRNA2_50928_c0~~gnl/TRDRNA2_/TRDRNA2_50928_c0_seq1.p1  ORF type:complete len:777 (+),score=99.82 gnl/TRDRNA2_/TRDRNA2_50928_c0_seq1:68-2398(+)